jgi:hypothetical protein
MCLNVSLEMQDVCCLFIGSFCAALLTLQAILCTSNVKQVGYEW